jgi:ankyrin repeat protein
MITGPVKLSAQEVLARYKSEDLPEFAELDLREVNQKGNFGNTPLHVAAVRGRLEEVDALIAGAAEVNARGERGNTPLHEAALQGHKDIVDRLLRSGADRSIRNEDGRTALQCASDLNRSEVEKALR